MALFWILWIFNALMALIPIYFFFVGLADGSITSRNIGLWAIIMLLLCGVLVSSVFLQSSHPGAAKLILIMAAIPGVFVLLYFLIVFTSKARWN